MSTTETRPAPVRRRPGAPVWLLVLARRAGSWRRRGLARRGHAGSRTARGVLALLLALVLLAAIKSAPLIRAAVGSPLWGQHVSALTDRLLGPKTYLAAAGALGLAYFSIGYLPAPVSIILGLLLAGLGLGVFSLPLCRMIYGHTPYGRVRRLFGVDGWADFWELHRGVSAHAVRHVAASQRPSLAAATLPAVPSRQQAGAVTVWAATLRRNALIERFPVSECGTWLGRSALGPWWGVQTYAAFRDVVGLIAPPQTGKTALLTHHVVDHPGAVISTSTKPEIYLYTAVLRAALAGWEHVALFNPDDLGGLGSTLRWDPVRGCADFRVATARAGLLVGARDRQDDKDARWDEWASEVLAGLLLVADLDGRNMHDIARWVHNPTQPEHGAPEALALMRESHPNRVPREVADSLGQLLSKHNEAKKTRDSVFFAMRGTVGFMSDPTAAALCTPGRDEPMFDVEAFINARGALYLLGSEEQNAGIAPLLAAFTGHVFATAKNLASQRRTGRLDPPLLLSLDEAALITPVPLHEWVADAGGRGIHIVFSVQTPSQLSDQWGEAGAKTILNATNALLIFGGLKEDDDLERASTWCGKRLELVPDPDGPTTETGGRGHAKFERVPVCPPDMVRRVPQWHFLLVYRTTQTTLCRMWPAWTRPDIKAAGYPPGAPAPSAARPAGVGSASAANDAEGSADATAPPAPHQPELPAPRAGSAPDELADQEGSAA